MLSWEDVNSEAGHEACKKMDALKRIGARKRKGKKTGGIPGFEMQRIKESKQRSKKRGRTFAVRGESGFATGERKKGGDGIAASESLGENKGD